VTSHPPRSTATTLLSPRQQAAQAAQWRFRDHVKVCRVPAGVRCYTCDDLNAKAAGLWVRAAVAEQRKAVTV
jgi:hypothetical protein